MKILSLDSQMSAETNCYFSVNELYLFDAFKTDTLKDIFLCKG